MRIHNQKKNQAKVVITQDTADLEQLTQVESKKQEHKNVKQMEDDEILSTPDSGEENQMSTKIRRISNTNNSVRKGRTDDLGVLHEENVSMNLPAQPNRSIYNSSAETSDASRFRGQNYQFRPTELPNNNKFGHIAFYYGSKRAEVDHNVNEMASQLEDSSEEDNSNDHTSDNYKSFGNTETSTSGDTLIQNTLNNSVRDNISDPRTYYVTNRTDNIQHDQVEQNPGLINMESYISNLNFSKLRLNDEIEFQCQTKTHAAEGNELKVTLNASKYFNDDLKHQYHGQLDHRSGSIDTNSIISDKVRSRIKEKFVDYEDKSSSLTYSYKNILESEPIPKYVKPVNTINEPPLKSIIKVRNDTPVNRIRNNNINTTKKQPTEVKMELIRDHDHEMILRQMAQEIKVTEEMYLKIIKEQENIYKKAKKEIHTKSDIVEKSDIKSEIKEEIKKEDDKTVKEEKRTHKYSSRKTNKLPESPLKHYRKFDAWEPDEELIRKNGNIREELYLQNIAEKQSKRNKPHPNNGSKDSNNSSEDSSSNSENSSSTSTDLSNESSSIMSDSASSTDGKGKSNNKHGHIHKMKARMKKGRHLSTKRHKKKVKNSSNGSDSDNSSDSSSSEDTKKSKMEKKKQLSKKRTESSDSSSDSDSDNSSDSSSSSKDKKKSKMKMKKKKQLNKKRTKKRTKSSDDSSSEDTKHRPPKEHRSTGFKEYNSRESKLVPDILQSSNPSEVRVFVDQCKDYIDNYNGRTPITHFISASARYGIISAMSEDIKNIETYFQTKPSKILYYLEKHFCNMNTLEYIEEAETIKLEGLSYAAVDLYNYKWRRLEMCAPKDYTKQLREKIVNLFRENINPLVLKQIINRISFTKLSIGCKHLSEQAAQLISVQRVLQTAEKEERQINYKIKNSPPLTNDFKSFFKEFKPENTFSETQLNSYDKMGNIVVPIIPKRNFNSSQSDKRNFSGQISEYDMQKAQQLARTQFTSDMSSQNKLWKTYDNSDPCAGCGGYNHRRTACNLWYLEGWSHSECQLTPLPGTKLYSKIPGNEHVPLASYAKEKNPMYNDQKWDHVGIRERDRICKEAQSMYRERQNVSMKKISTNQYNQQQSQYENKYNMQSRESNNSYQRRNDDSRNNHRNDNRSQPTTNFNKSNNPQDVRRQNNPYQQNDQQFSRAPLRSNNNNNNSGLPGIPVKQLNGDKPYQNLSVWLFTKSEIVINSINDKNDNHVTNILRYILSDPYNFYYLLTIL